MEPTKEQYETYTSDFCDFSHKSPDPFHAAKNAADILENRGFTRLYENESWKLCRGGSYYFLRNDCCLIAFKLPKEEFSGFKIFSCHGDSPAFKIKENPERKLETLELTIDGDFVDMKYTFKPVKFDRIRRITGYLVGTMDRWNDAKTAEEHDRVKHSLELS